MREYAAGVRAHGLSLARQPLNVMLLVALPPVVILIYGRGVEAFSVLAETLGAGTDLGTSGRVTGAVFSSAFLTGILGLFQVISARRGDERLVLCGFSRAALFASRLTVVLAAAAVAATVSLVVLLSTLAVTAPVAAFGGLFAAGVLYGLIGMLVGVLLPRELEGSLLLVFLVDVDTALSSGLFQVRTAIPELFAMNRPHAILEAAVSAEPLPWTDVWVALGHAAVLVAATLTVYTRLVGGRGGAR